MTDDDLVKRLKKQAVSKKQAFNAQGDEILFAVYENDYVKDIPANQTAADALVYIEELEAKLVKAVEAMSNLRQAIRESGVKRTGCMYPAVLSFDAILTELKGDKP